MTMQTQKYSIQQPLDRPISVPVTVKPSTPSGAFLSGDGRYRYRLWRIWEPNKPLLNIIGLNPSTADATEDDATMRRCIGFAEREGFGGLVMTNLFAYRATDPSAMRRADDPIGQENDQHVREAAQQCSQVWFAWGNGGRFLDRNTHVLSLIERECHCLGTTGLGEPRHPLYLRKDEQIAPYHRSIPEEFSAEEVSKAIRQELSALCTSTFVGNRPSWTRMIRGVFNKLATDNDYLFAPSNTTGEWLYDHVWYRSAIHHGVERTVSIPLVMECEWHNSLSSIAEDFDKLLLANADLRVLVCGWYPGFDPDPVVAYCKAAVEGFHQLNKGAKFQLCFIPELAEMGSVRFHEIIK